MPFIQRFIIVAIVFLASQPLNSQKVAAELRSELIDNESAGCIVSFPMLHTENIVSLGADKNEKARKVYDALRDHLNGSSSELRKVLDQSKVRYLLNYVSGSIIIDEADRQLVDRISQMAGVRKIYHNPTFSIRYTYESDQLQLRNAQSTWGLQMTGVDSVHQMNITGQDVVIAGNDTGFDWTHPALKEKYRGWNSDQADHNYNWHDGVHMVSPLSDTSLQNPCGIDIKFPCDDNSHGTHTMGTMVGSIADSLTIGMAPGARWIATRNMERGNGSLASYLDCFNWYLAPTDTNGLNPDPLKAPDVINNSWYCSVAEGCSEDTRDLLLAAVFNLTQAGIVVVISAGNDGPECETIYWAPNISQDGFIIGAVAQNDTIARFSSRGLVNIDSSGRMKPDVVAPGVGILSSIPGNAYAYFSGTSMAGPHVSGLVALLISANPALRGEVDTITSIIRKTAIPKFSDQDCSGVGGSSYPNPVYGYGRIDALAAVRKARDWKLTSKKAKDDYLLLYPNPAEDEVTVSLHTRHKMGPRHLTVVDMHGRVLQELKLRTGQVSARITVNHLTPGVYAVIYRDTAGVLTSKIVVSR